MNLNGPAGRLRAGNKAAAPSEPLGGRRSLGCQLINGPARRVGRRRGHALMMLTKCCPIERLGGSLGGAPS